MTGEWLLGIVAFSIILMAVGFLVLGVAGLVGGLVAVIAGFIIIVSIPASVIITTILIVEEVTEDSILDDESY